MITQNNKISLGFPQSFFRMNMGFKRKCWGWIPEGKRWGGRIWEIGIDTYTLLISCIKWTMYKIDVNILCSTENPT